MFFRLLIFSALIFEILCQNCDKRTCSECIQELDCVWCVTPNDGNNCKASKLITAEWCPSKNDTINPKLKMTILKDSPFSSSGTVVQVKPQRIRLSLRKGQEYIFKFQYRKSENYPVDLYYLMDLSKSMEPYRAKLSVLGVKLAEAMRKLTNDFRIGFGSFVDKVELPFTSTVPSKLKHPCGDGSNGELCVRPYSYKNDFSLSPNDTLFEKKVGEAKVSGNLDSPEGGFDAIMQAIVCKKEIGWRSSARHLLVFSTDAHFHIAGDGKLAGVVIPNDGKCHMQNNEYVEALKYDYPSVSHINKVAKDNNINIIFAIADQAVKEAYVGLSKRIENSNTGILKEDSGNVIDLVIDNYNKIVGSVTMTASAPDNVKVIISSNCKPNTKICHGISLGQVVDFTATIKAIDCLPHPQTITIKPEGLEESIQIDLDVFCDCSECNKNTLIVKNAPKCYSNGDLVCGVCSCHDGFRGKMCECPIGASNSFALNATSNCVKDNVTCSNAGVCKCGVCECTPRRTPGERNYGTYCQCNNYSCMKHKGKTCGGNGVCNCDKTCECSPGWKGEACDCADTNSTCIDKDSDLICSGRGECVCGECRCAKGEDTYTGDFCEKCITCKICDELKDCVECQAYKKGKYNEEECAKQCSKITTQLVDKLEPPSTLCTIQDKECPFNFFYETFLNGDITVTAPKEKCPKPNIIAWVSGVVGGILLAGLLMLLIWKSVTTVHDRREYAKFENERKKLKWHRNDNPLYKEATTTFNNPVFNSIRNSFRKRSST